MYSCCRKCKSKYKSVRYYERRKDDPENQWVTNALNWSRYRAKKKDLVFSLEKAHIEALLKDFTCYYCSTDLNFTGTRHAKNNSPSLDRVIPEKGYAPENIVLACHKCNEIKSDANVDRLMMIVRGINRFQDQLQRVQ